MISIKHIYFLSVITVLTFSNLFSMREYYNPDAIQVGIYSGAGYNFLQDLQASAGDMSLSLGKIPAEIKKLIPAGSEVKSSFILLGLPEESTETTVYNITYHPVVREWLRKTNPQADLHNFNITTKMGIFNPRGAMHVNGAEGISFNGLSDQQVVLHPGPQVGSMVADAYSPNNARFSINPKNKVSSFWTMAVSQDQRHTYVAHVLLIQDKQLEEKIKTYFPVDELIHLTLAEALKKFSGEEEGETKEMLMQAHNLISSESQPHEEHSAAAAAHS